MAAELKQNHNTQHKKKEARRCGVGRFSACARGVCVFGKRVVPCTGMTLVVMHRQSRHTNVTSAAITPARSWKRSWRTMRGGSVRRHTFFGSEAALARTDDI